MTTKLTQSPSSIHLEYLSEFLDLSFDNWPQAESFCIAKSFIDNLKVINDIAEALKEESNLWKPIYKLLTNNEEHKQVVSDYQKN